MQLYAYFQTIKCTSDVKKRQAKGNAQLQGFSGWNASRSFQNGRLGSKLISTGKRRGENRPLNLPQTKNDDQMVKKG